MLPWVELCKKTPKVLKSAQTGPKVQRVTKLYLLNDMNLRLGAVTKNVTNKTKDMKVCSLEQSLKKMLMDFKEEASKQTGDFRLEF